VDEVQDTDAEGGIGTGKSVVLIQYQLSIVVKSLEKGLEEMGYRVTLMNDEIETLKNLIASTDVFLVYLKEAVPDDIRTVDNLSRLCDSIKDKNRKLIFIGTDKEQEDITGAVPAAKDYAWLRRPVVLNNLISEIEA
jgi:hypothetical protein